jgi:hypothetical protein
MHHVIGTIVIGAIAAGTTRNPGVRSGLRWLVKGGIVAKRKVESLGAAAAEKAREIVDEARADLDEPGTERSS